jgi:glycosidase
LSFDSTKLILSLSGFVLVENNYLLDIKDTKIENLKSVLNDLERAKKLEEQPVKFYNEHDQYGILSRFSQNKFKLEGKSWKTIEQ